MDISAENLDELRMILELGAEDEVPAGFIETYKRFSKRKSMCCNSGVVTPEELVMLVTACEGVYTSVEVLPSQEIPVPPEPPVASTEGIKEGDSVLANFKGLVTTGTVLNVNDDHVRVKVDGDAMKFRKFDISELKLKKD